MATITAADISYQAANESAKQQMDFQKMMSDTAHQREVADLKAAGLNPILSAHGQGAQVTAGAAGYVGDDNAKKFDEQVAQYELSMKELEQQQALEILKEQTNAKIMLKSLETLGDVASGKSPSGGHGSGGSRSGKKSSSNFKDNEKSGLTGNEDIDNALANWGKRYPVIGLALGAASYLKNNASVGNVAPTGSSRKAQVAYEENTGKKSSSNVNPDSSYRYTSLPGYTSAKKYLDNITKYNLSQVRMPGKR